MFESIENQNYSNYHIIIVDDNSPSKMEATELVKYIQHKYPKLYEKVQYVVKNEQRLYTGGNIRVRVSELCKYNDIVVNIGANSFFVGRQTFKVINAIYQNN
jgi:glycosyltransferase involved in cell wall biosynthesis